MVQVMITHLCDGERWLAAWDEKGPGSVTDTFESAGIRVVGRFRGATNPNLTGVLVEADSPSVFADFAAASEGNPNFLKLGVDLETLNYLMSID